MHYQLCPKCNGQGIVSKPPWVAGDQTEWTSTQASHYCDVCGGAKILLVPDREDNNFYPMVIDFDLLKNNPRE